MTTSLIITTYNWKEALALTLKSALFQTQLPEEIIVADDGSTSDTKDLIKNFQQESRTPINHVWQEDKGFRASKIRNKAVAQAKGSYLILVDGDVILHRKFIEDHKNQAQQNFFIQGGRVLIGKSKTSALITHQKFYTFHPFSLGIGNRKNTIRSESLSKLFSFPIDSLKAIRSCNWGLWRSDFINVNGFNEDFEGWGREDSELAARLLNSGVKRFNLKFQALVYHLYHKENSRHRLRKNDEILDQTVNDKIHWCDNGVNQYLAKDLRLD